MAINFPNSPSDGDPHTDGVSQWTYSSANNSWTVSNSSPISLTNGTNFDNTITYLVRSGDQNVLTAANGLTYNLTDKTLAVKGNVSQLQNMFELKNSSGTVLNSFNQRGVLTSAGRIFYTGTTPAPNASDTGLLWYNTTDSNLYVWNGTTWVISAGGVDLTTNQTVSGTKTFSSNILLSSTATINGQGASKSIIFKPTNSGSTATTALTLTSTTATFDGTLDFPSVGTTAKTIIATLADDQTVVGDKTHTGNIFFSGTSSNIAGDAGTNGTASGTDIRIRSNMATDTRYIKVRNNSQTSDGIVLWPKNANGLGYVSVVGSMTVSENLTVTGSILGSFTAPSTTFGQLASTAGTGAWNINTNPSSIGTLTFTSTTTGAANVRGITVTNSSSTATAKFLVRRERNSTPTCVSIHKITLNPSATVFINATTGPAAATGVTITYLGGDETASPAFVLTGTNSPVQYTISLAQ